MDEKEILDKLESPEFRASILKHFAGTEESYEEYVGQYKDVMETVEHAKTLMEAGDAVLIHHFREIICYVCDIIRYLDSGYDHMLMQSLVSMAVSMSRDKPDVWQSYIENHADQVNGSIADKENPDGRMDS